MVQGKPVRVSGSIGVSAIVPTVGRVDSLNALLESLIAQTHRVDEVVIADASVDQKTLALAIDPKWQGIVVHHIAVAAPNAVRQRMAAIEISSGENLLLLDDDVVLEPDCLQHMMALLETDDVVVAVTADFNNQSWPHPTRFWQLYLRHVLKLEWVSSQGRVVGPLLRFGFNPVPSSPQPMEWLGSGSSLVRRSAFITAGGFSDFFLHRCTINEDVDLGLKLRRVGRIMFCPAARMAHHHAPGGRVTKFQAAEDDLFNRFFILRRTLGLGFVRAFGLVVLYFGVETISQFLGCIRRLNFRGFVAPLTGRLRAFGRILIPIAR
jgi:GT2 family glycosyltransferase